jgi:hypothetical protein
MPEPVTPKGYVLRALAASEIAESCTEPAIRESFFELAAAWLSEAEKAYGDRRADRGSALDGPAASPA